MSSTEKNRFFINVQTQQIHQHQINVETTLIISVHRR